MKFLKHSPMKALAALLAICMLAAPVAAAQPAGSAALTTPAQEDNALASGQRSILNPDGVFTLPDPNATQNLLHPDSWTAGKLIFSNMFEQVLRGNGDAQAIMRIMAHAPVVKEDELPEETVLPQLGLSTILLNQSAHNYYVVLRETENPDHYEILIIYTDKAGKQHYTETDISYFADTGLLYDHSGKGLLRTGFDFESGQFLLRASLDTWARKFGYHITYDYLSFLLMIFVETLRFPFYYNGKDWQIQLWKGTYPFMNGGEIGVYEQLADFPLGTTLYYGSDLRLEMSMRIYDRDQLLFDYGQQKTWWLAGFRLSGKNISARRMHMTGTILFEDPAMLDAFLGSVRAQNPAKFTWQLDAENPLLFRFDWAAG